MKNLVFILFLLLFQSNNLFSQTLEWAKAILGNHAITIHSHAIDLDENNVFTGHFFGTVDFNPGALTEIKTAKGLDDIFILKLDSDGNFLWVKTFGSNIQDQGYDININNLNQIIVSGLFMDSIDFDPGIGTHIESAENTFNSNSFILSLSPNGDFNWVKNLNLNYRITYSSFIELDKNNNIIFSSKYRDTLYPDSSGLNSIISKGFEDFFIQKLDPVGNLIWIKSFGGKSIENIHTMILDFNDDIVISGTFRDSVDFDSDSLTLPQIAKCLHDVFFMKIKSNGDFDWVRTIGAKNHRYCSRVEASAVGRKNSLYFVGIFDDTLDLDPGTGVHNLINKDWGNPDLYLLNLDVDGNFIWAKSIDTEYASGYKGKGISYFDEHIYLWNTFFGNADLDFNSNTPNISSKGSSDVFFTKIDPNGNTIWVKSFGGTLNEKNSSIQVKKSPKGEVFVYLTGTFRSQVDFGLGSTPYYLNSTNNFGDVFIAKYHDNFFTTIDENDFENDFEIFPNPSSNHVFIKNSDNEKTKLFIYNTNGKLIHNSVFQGNTEINTNLFNNGYYLVKVINSKNQSKTKKLIISH